MSRRAAVIVALSLTACGSSPEVKKTVVERPVEAVPAPAPVACIPADTEYFQDTSFADSAYRFCTQGESGPACWRFDITTDTLTPFAAPPEASEAEPPDVSSGPHWRYTKSANKLELCVSDDSCRVVKLPAKLVMHEYTKPSASADGTMVVATLSSGEMSVKPTIVTWDVASGKQLARQKVGDDSYTCGGGEFVGNTVLIALNVCAGPGGLAWLAKPKDLKKIADLGPKDYGQYGPIALPLDGDDYLFLEQGARSVMVQNVTTGKVVSRLDLGPQYKKIEDSEDVGYDVPADGGAIWKLSSGGYAVALEGSAGKIAVVDASGTKLVSIHPVPRCAATP